MKKYFSLLVAFFLCIGIILPINVSAASKTYYYPVAGTSKITSGIYKGTINGKSTAILKQKSTKTDYPIYNVQVVGKNIYYTKFLSSEGYVGANCGGLLGDKLAIYKRNSKGKVSKVVKDNVSSDSVQPFYVKGNYIYYPKLNKDITGDFTIVRSTLDGKKKKTLKKSVDNFWVNGKYIYYVSKGSLYRMDMYGKKSKKYPQLKIKLDPMNPCVGINYQVLFNGKSYHGIVATDYFSDNLKTVFFDLSTLKETKIKNNNAFQILDVDGKKKRYIAVDDNDNKISMYNFQGKRIKKSKVKMEYSYPSNREIISADAVKGEVIYISGTKLKKLKF